MKRYRLVLGMFFVLSLVISTVPVSASAALVDFGANVDVPTELRVAPVAGKSRLSWKAPTGSTPTKYRIYTRLMSEPSDTYLAETTALIYDTAFNFSGANESNLRAFEVSSVFADGSESFLTVPVYDNDTDGDGLPDAREQSLGSSITNIDTDGDGLDDGQEYFFYNTSPTLTDTDGNGVSDYYQALNITPPAAATSIVPNGDFETVNGSLPQSWSQGGWGTNVRTFTYPVAGYNGSSKAAKVTITSYTDGDAKWYFNPVAVTPGTTYTYGQYYIGTITTNVTIRYTMTDGTFTYVTLGNPAASASFTQYTKTFTVPANVTAATVFPVLSGVGSLTIDNVTITPQGSVTPTPTPSPTPTPTPVPAPANLVLNPALETVNGSAPQHWTASGWGTNTRTLTYPVAGRSGNGARVAMTAYTDGDAKYYFNPVMVSPNAVYTFSMFYSANTTITATARYTKTDGTFQYVWLGDLAPTTGFASYTRTFTTPANVTAMTVFPLLQAVGTLTIDDVSLVVGNGSSTPTANSAPTIALIGSAAMTITQNTQFADPGATATDVEEGNITAKIVKNGSVNSASVGNYTLTYTVSDAQGLSTSVTRTVQVVTPMPAPVLNWGLNGGVSSSLKYLNAMGSKYTLRNSGVTSIAGKGGSIDGGSWFAGAGNALNTGDGVYQLNTNDYTIFVRMKPGLINTVSTETTSNQPLFHIQDQSNTGRPIVSISLAAGKARCFSSGLLASAVVNHDLTGSTLMNTATWYDVVCTRSAGVERLYVNGVKEVEATFAEGNLPLTYAGQANMYVGAAYNPQGATSTRPYFTGAIDDVRIYGVALTQTQVQTLASMSQLSMQLALDGLDGFVPTEVLAEVNPPLSLVDEVEASATSTATTTGDVLSPSQGVQQQSATGTAASAAKGNNATDPELPSQSQQSASDSATSTVIETLTEVATSTAAIIFDTASTVVEMATSTLDAVVEVVSSATSTLIGAVTE